MKDAQQDNQKLAIKLVTVAVAMFAFGVFVMPPMYDTFCELTGLNQAGIKIASDVPETQAGSRTVKVRFDATTNSSLNWKFGPAERSIDVTVGTPAEAFYVAENLTGEALAGMATFNVSPPSAARYFVKVECFCFSQQVLAGNERREMPVYFFVQPDLPENVEELTLSYTFFKNNDPIAAQTAP